jgi:hypothetical protein
MSACATTISSADSTCAVSELAPLFSGHTYGALNLEQILAEDGNYYLSVNDGIIVGKSEVIQHKTTWSLFPDVNSYRFLRVFLYRLGSGIPGYDDPEKNQFFYGRKRYSYYVGQYEENGHTVFTISISIESLVKDWGWAGMSYLYSFRCEGGMLKLFKTTVAG